jgi:hypothetical protein
MAGIFREKGVNLPFRQCIAVITTRCVRAVQVGSGNLVAFFLNTFMNIEGFAQRC